MPLQQLAFDPHISKYDGSRNSRSILVRLLNRLSSLEKLIVPYRDGKTFDAEFLELLKNGAPQTPFVSCLTGLSISDSSSIEVDMAALLNTLQTSASQGLRDVLISRQTSLFQETHAFKSRTNRIDLALAHSALRLRDETIVEGLHLLRSQGANVAILVEKTSILQ